MTTHIQGRITSLHTLAPQRCVFLRNVFGRFLTCVNVDTQYSWVKSTKSPSFCMNTIVASLTNLMALLSQSRDCSSYVSRRPLAPPPLCAERLWPTRIRLRAFVWHQLRLADVTCSWSWRLWGISPAIHNFWIAALHLTGSCYLIWSLPKHTNAKANSFLTCTNFL